MNERSQGSAPSDPVPSNRAFPCPRCHEAVTEAFYGPCAGCRDQLRATLGSDPRNIATDDYVPKVNVTPNAVATKD